MSGFWMSGFRIPSILSFDLVFSDFQKAANSRRIEGTILRDHRKVGPVASGPEQGGLETVPLRL